MKKKIKIIVAVILVIGLIGIFTSGGSDDTTSNQTDNVEEKEETKKEYKMKEKVKVGNVVYKVNKKEVTKKVGDKYFNTKAQGTFVVLDIEITNNEDEALTVSSSYFKLLNGKKEYESSSDAGIYLSENSIIYKDVNPGVTLKGRIAFDVPDKIAKSKDTKLEVQTGFWGTETETISLK